MRTTLALLLTVAATTTHAFDLTSTAFAPNATIPTRHTCDGDDRSPPLAWHDAPAGTKRFALVCEDPDAPAGTWTHWLVYDLPATTASLPEAVAPDATIPGGARQGTNDFHRIGWGGPCPPRGAAPRYVFRLYALDAETNLARGATPAAFAKAIEGHVLGRAELTGRYARR